MNIKKIRARLAPWFVGFNHPAMDAVILTSIAISAFSLIALQVMK
ncbi:hypothetical protein [Rhizorhabdus sp.]|nr:hypothetical protein [Rhizorhabdus sp.]